MLLAPPRPRIAAIDLVRGVIMIIMALDHTRDRVGGAALSAPVDHARVIASRGAVLGEPLDG